jgi:hypothetical protein
MPLNEPGNWKYFVSHVQRECSTEAVELAAEWGKQHCWLDRYMEDKSVAAKAEGVKGSKTFVCILSEGYFKSDYCCNEMRWAFENEKPVVSTYKSGVNVGALLNTAPDDFRERIMAINQIPLNTDDVDFFAVSMSKITKRLGKLSVAPAAQAPAQKPAQKPPPVLAKDGTDITELVALVRDGTDEQKQYAAGALNSLACNYDDDNKIPIAQAGGIPPLVALVRDGNDAQKQYAAAALGSLAVNADNKIAIAKAGGIPPLVALVRDGNADGKAEGVNAADALCTLANYCADNKIAIAKAKREAGLDSDSDSN